MKQLHTVLDALETEAADFISEYEASEPPSHLSEAIAIVKQMMQAEPVACLVETEQGVMVWPIDDFNDAGTYCEPNHFPQYLYTHPAPQAVLASKVDRLKVFDDAEAAMRRNPELSWRDAIADQFALAYGIMGGKK